MVPAVFPDGVFGVNGGLLVVPDIVMVFGVDQLLSSLCSSCALTLMLYVPADVHVCDCVLVLPLFIGSLHSSTVSSPFQSQPYLIVSFSGSVVLVMYV